MSDAAEKPATFEDALRDLDRIVRQLEDGDTSLEQALTHYEKGVGLIKLCHEQLKAAELRIQTLLGETGEGQPIVRPFEHAATVDAAVTKTPRARKTPGS